MCKFTKEQFIETCVQRIASAKAMLHDAIGNQLPEGFDLVDITASENAVFQSILVKEPSLPQLEIRFSHSIGHRYYDGSTKPYIPTTEKLRAICVSNAGSEYETQFGFDGKLCVEVLGWDDLENAVKTMVSSTLSQYPFYRLEWKIGEDNQRRTYELFANGKAISKIWRNPLERRWSATDGTCKDNLAEAKDRTEAAARFWENNRHQERLSSAHLGLMAAQPVQINQAIGNPMHA